MTAALVVAAVLVVGGAAGSRSDSSSSCIVDPMSLLESKNALTQLKSYGRNAKAHRMIKNNDNFEEFHGVVDYPVCGSTSSRRRIVDRNPSSPRGGGVSYLALDDNWATIVLGILIGATFTLFLKKKRASEQNAISDEQVLTIQHRILAQFAHEMRNKVTAPATFLEHVDELVSSSTQPELLFSELKTMKDDIAFSVSLLREADELVQTRLALHSLMTGNYQTAPHTLDLLDLLRSQTSSKLPLGAGENEGSSSVCVKCIIPPEYENCSVCLDSHVFDHVSRNLLSNATKNTLSGSIEIQFLGITTTTTVTVTTEEEEEDMLLTFAVKDTGCGIPPEIVERLFIEDVVSGGERGVGLGLISCQQFLLVVGGDIWLENTTTAHDRDGAGGGTEFRFVIPGKVMAAAPPPLAEASVVVASSEDDDDDDDDISASSTVATTNLPAAATVVVVDDSRLIRKALITKLRAVAKSRYCYCSWAFVEHETVESVLPTIEKLKTHQEDVIVTIDENLDTQGGCLKGQDLIRALVDAKFKGVIVSASGDESAGSHHVELGAHLQLNKPFPPSDTISSLLETAFGRSSP